MGGCFCNDLRYVAEEFGVELTAIAVDVTVELDGTPLVVTSAIMSVHVETASPGMDISALLKRTEDTSAVTQSVRRGFPVTISPA
ncbi:MAG: OsmC family protein [Devosia sp.]